MTDVPFDQVDDDLRAAVLAAGRSADPAFRADLRARLASQDAHIVRRSAPDTGRRWWAVAAAAAAVVVLAAVLVLADRTSEEIGPATDPDPGASVPVDNLITALAGDVWVAVDFPRAVDLPVLRFKVGMTRPEVVLVHGNWDCNDLSGEIELDGATVARSDLMQSAMDCGYDDPPVALPSVGASMTISGATLTIREPGAVTEYTALGSLAVADPTELDGAWLLGDDAFTITDGVVSPDAPDTIGYIARLRERLAASGVAAWLIDGGLIVDMGGQPGWIWRLERAEPAPPPALVDQLVGRTWVGVDGDWRTAAPTLAFDSLDREPGLLGVATDDGCNAGSGTFRLDGAVVVDADVMGTEIGCEHEVAGITGGSTLAVTGGVLTVRYEPLGLVTTYVALDALEVVPAPDLTGNWRAHGVWVSVGIDGTLAVADAPPAGDASRGLDAAAIRGTLAAGPAEAWRLRDGWIIGSPSGGFVQLVPEVVPAAPEPDDGETAEGWISTALPGPGGEPIITTGTARHIVEVAGRRLILGTEPSACCSSLLAWVDDGDGVWRWIDLDDQFGMSTDEPALLTHGPLDVESNGALAVAVGAIQTTDGDTLASEPLIWVVERSGRVGGDRRARTRAAHQHRPQFAGMDCRRHGRRPRCRARLGRRPHVEPRGHARLRCSRRLSGTARRQHERRGVRDRIGRHPP